MTRVRMNLFTSLDGYTPADPTPENPMGADWGRITAAHGATRTFRERVLGDTSGKGTTGVDERYIAAFFEGVGSEIMGAGMFGLHAFPDDAHWKGWWGANPSFSSSNGSPLLAADWRPTMESTPASWVGPITAERALGQLQLLRTFQ